MQVLSGSLSRTVITPVTTRRKQFFISKISFNSKSVKILLLCFISFFISSCAEYQRTDFDKPAFSSQDFKTFTDMSVIYVFRDDNGIEQMLPVNIDGKEITRTKQNSFFRVKVKPGEHEISSAEGNYSSISIKTRAGRNYYILQEAVESLNKTGSNFLQVTELEGQHSIKNCRLIKTDN